jgi:hypothetical protein
MSQLLHSRPALSRRDFLKILGAVLEYVKEGDQVQYGDQAFIDELLAWIRFNKADVLINNLST